MEKTESTQDIDLAAAEAKLTPYLEAAQELGIALRPITGQVLRLAEKIELDLESVGMATTGDHDDPGDFFDDLMLAIWLLGDRVENIIPALSDFTLVAATSLAWRMEHLPTLHHESAAMRAFVARWIEHRLQVAAVYGVDEEPAEEAVA